MYCALDKTSVNCVSDIVSCYIDLKNQMDVKVAKAKHVLPPDLHAICNKETNVYCSKSAYWVRWWSRERILKMFCKAYTLQDTKEWDTIPNTNNPVVSALSMACHCIMC